jgi:hypothetical protein
MWDSAANSGSRVVVANLLAALEVVVFKVDSAAAKAALVVVVSRVVVSRVVGSVVVDSVEETLVADSAEAKVALVVAALVARKDLLVTVVPVFNP